MLIISQKEKRKEKKNHRNKSYNCLLFICSSLYKLFLSLFLNILISDKNHSGIVIISECVLCGDVGVEAGEREGHEVAQPPEGRGGGR